MNHPFATPVIDRRQGQPWSRRLPARLGTGSLWIGAFSLLGPIKLTGLLLGSSLLSACLLGLDRRQRQTPPPVHDQPALTLTAPQGITRAMLAEEIGLCESQLFRARHARICTVVHDPQGRISDIVYPKLLQVSPLLHRDAHPVG